MKCLTACVLLIGFAPVANTKTAFAQTAPTIDAVSVDVDAEVRAVTVYRGRASVTRRAVLTLEPGLYDLEYRGLPETVQPDTLQAHVDGLATVVGVDYEQRTVAQSVSAEIAALDARIVAIQDSLAELSDQRELLKAQSKFLDDVTVRVTHDASTLSGTTELDLDAVRNQMAFVTEERARLLADGRELDTQQRDLEQRLRVVQAERNAVAGRSNINRMAIVSLVVSAPSETTVDLSYLVTNATWEPTYNVRAASDGASVTIEYDAMLMQRTGEDWNDVELTLSTAQPALAANPPSLAPWYVDIVADKAMAGFSDDAAVETEALYKSMPARRGKAAPGPETYGYSTFRLGLEALAADAAVGGSGPSVTFGIPRRVTVKTNATKQQRTRIASIDTNPQYIHVAIPALTDAVYVRGELTNESSFQLLPGRASIFVGQDYIGPTVIGSVAPHGQFDLHFGIDPAVKATRQLITRNTTNRGLFKNRERLMYDFRLEIDNGAGKGIMVELWDRYPVSRNEQVSIELIDNSRSLATDAEYVDEQLPTGMLKWIVSVPSAARGDRALLTTYTVQIEKPHDLMISGLPE